MKKLLYPRSPYAVSKLYAYWITVNYREAYRILRAMEFYLITSPQLEERLLSLEKITMALARIKLGMQKLYLGNLNAMRDWGHAKRLC